MIRERLASLRLRLWLLVLLAFMPALGLIFYTAVEQRQHAVQEVKNQALRMAQIVSSDQERRIDGTRYLLSGLGTCAGRTRGRGGRMRKVPVHSPER